jgi:hypothetical protein
MNLDVTTGELDLGENSLYQMYLDKLRTKYAGHPTVTDADLQEAARQGVVQSGAGFYIPNEQYQSNGNDFLIKGGTSNFDTIWGRAEKLSGTRRGYEDNQALYEANQPNREALELEADMRRDQANQDEVYRQEMHRMANDRNLAMHNEQGVQQFGEDYSQNKLYPRGGMGDAWHTPVTGRQGYLKNYNNHPTNSFLSSWMYPTDPNKDAKEYQQSYEKLPQTIW